MNFYLATGIIEKKAFAHSNGAMHEDLRLIQAESSDEAKVKYQKWINDFNVKNNLSYWLHEVKIIETIV